MGDVSRLRPMGQMSETCPECQHKVNLDVLVVEGGVFKLGTPE